LRSESDSQIFECGDSRDANHDCRDAVDA
jgi:hypothetical protein